MTPTPGQAPARERRTRTPRAARRTTGRRGAAFYAEALSAEDRAALAEATAVEGVDQELAVLRLLLRRWLREHPDDVVVAMRAIELLARATNAARRQATDADEAAQLSRMNAGLRGVLGLLAEAGSEQQ